MKKLRQDIQIRQWEQNIARAWVTFPELPGYTIEVQLAAMQLGGVRRLTLFGAICFNDRLVENVVACLPNPSVHCGMALSELMMAGEEFTERLINPILGAVKQVVSQDLQAKPAYEASYFEENLLRVLGDANAQG